MSNDNHATSSIIDEIMRRDDELVEEMDQVRGDSEKFYKLNRERLDLYNRVKGVQLDAPTAVLFHCLRSFITRDVALFGTRKEFDEQISQIISRLDRIDDEIKTIKQRLNPS